MAEARIYEALLKEAAKEFDAWDADVHPVWVMGYGWVKKDAKARVVRCECGRRAHRRGKCRECLRAEYEAAHPVCLKCRKNKCYAKDLCRKCYCKEYNAGRVRRPPKRKTKRQQRLCKCGKPAKVGPKCWGCYMRRYRARRKLVSTIPCG